MAEYEYSYQAQGVRNFFTVLGRFKATDMKAAQGKVFRRIASDYAAAGDEKRAPTTDFVKTQLVDNKITLTNISTKERTTWEQWSLKETPRWFTAAGRKRKEDRMFAFPAIRRRRGM